MTFLLHWVFGLGFAGIGWAVRDLCPHLRHKLTAATILCALEAAVMVRVVG